MKKVAFIDWDGTLRKGFTINDWFSYLSKTGLINSKTQNDLMILFNKYNNAAISHDLLAHETALKVAQALKGKSMNDIELATSSFVEQDSSLFSFAEEACSYFLSNGFFVYVISGAPLEVVVHYKQLFSGKAELRCLRYDSAKGFYTGKILNNPGISHQKEKIIREFISRLKNKPIIISMGNSESDMPLFNTADFAIVVDGKELSLRCPSISITESTNWENVSNTLSRINEAL